MSSYPYDSIVVNGRTIPIDDIMAGRHPPALEVEAALFSFIKDWLNARESFTLKTSGSTGVPKAITIARDQMITSAKRTQQVLGLKKGDTALVCLHPDYIAGKMMLVRCFVTGMKIVFAAPSGNPFYEIRDNDIDFCALVPLQVYHILQSGHLARLDRIRTVLIGGGKVTDDIIARLREIDCRCYSTYGMTETVSHVALRLLNTQDTTDCYVALPGVALSLDGRGCLVIDCAWLHQPVVTNDIVELRDNKTFIWLGRWDNIINTGGVKIVPEKIEEMIENCFRDASIGNRFFLASIPDLRLGNKVILVIEGTHPEEDIRTSLQALKVEEPYAYPQLLLFIPRFIEAGNGKVNRNATTLVAIQSHHSSD
ncbi:MAG: AMP-binding protein [Chryseolinea sp.]